MISYLLLAAAATAALLATLRWLRVAQREHYLAGAASRFAARWWAVTPWNPSLLLVGVAGAAAAFWVPWAGLAAAAVAASGPLGLGLRGRTSPLRWTARLRRLAGVTALLAAALPAVASLAGAAVPVALLVGMGMPLLVDAALLLLAPLERGLGARFVEEARAKLSRIAPKVVAITGSYGKTTTKEYLRHLLGGRLAVVASPASFNNAMGLARAVNEHLAPGTEVFIAEMGTYGPGEIAQLVRWVPPDIAVITAIGPVHLERFGSLESTARAKEEILAPAAVAVLNVDDVLLAAMADRFPRRVVRCSTVDRSADVAVLASGEVLVGGATMARVDTAALFASNLACAIGAAIALGLSPEDLIPALPGLPSPPHRRSVVKGQTGFTIVDDTYNSNPAGAAAALDLLERLGDPGGRLAVITPGMVELGDRQEAENEEFARAAAKLATDLVVVGHTNRRALQRGAAGGSAAVLAVPTRETAVAWARGNLGEGDAALYENDLPDHYP